MGLICKFKNKFVNKYKDGEGFTLIELLVVMGILLVIMAITLIAVNPIENFHQTSDVTASAISNDFIKSNIAYFTHEKKYPWDTDQNCKTELEGGNSLFDIPSCINQLAKGGQLEQSYMSNPELKNIYVNKCGEKVVICYQPSSKKTYPDAKFDKFGVSQPGCPGQGGGNGCYWCKPLTRGMCDDQGSPTPTGFVSNSPTPNPPTPTPNYDDLVPGYTIDQSKFFRTYSVYFFDYPGFPSIDGALWNTQISTSPDFSASYPDQINSYGIPSPSSQDAPLNDSYAALRKITNKYVGFTSIIPYNYNNQHCGQTIYWRITNFYSPNFPDKKYGPTYTGTIDCTTTVGMVDPPISWYSVFDMGGTYKQKYYEPLWDFDKNGTIDFTDYWLGAFSTKIRYGGWQPPE